MLDHFTEMRTNYFGTKKQGLSTPSQERFVRYFENLITLPDPQVSIFRVSEESMMHRVASIQLTLGCQKSKFAGGIVHNPKLGRARNCFIFTWPNCNVGNFRDFRESQLYFLDSS